MPKKDVFRHHKGWKVIAEYITHYKRELFALLVLSVVSAATNALAPYFVGQLIDGIITPRSFSFGAALVVPSAFFFIAAWFFAKVIADIADRQINTTSEKMNALVEGDYLVAGLSKIMEFPMSFQKNQKIGEVFDALARASKWLAQIISNIVVDLAPQFLSIAVALGIGIFVNLYLALILIAAVILYVFILGRMSRGLTRLHFRTHSAFNRAYGDAWDTISNIQSVKQAGAERYEARRLYRNFHLRAITFWLKIHAIWQNVSFLQRLLVSLTQLSIFFLSILFIQRGEMTVGELVMFNAYAAMFFGPFVVLGRNWQTFQNGMAAIVRAEKILHVAPEIYEPQGAIVLGGFLGDVEFQGVTFSYQRRGKAILQNINFKVSAGTSVALVGESGVGKTTLVDLISLYYRPTQGKIYIDGHTILRLNIRMLRSQIAIVPQDIILFNDTVRNNIRYGRFGATDEEIAEAARAAHADEFIEMFPHKYNQKVGERGMKLSSGQKQRIAIARAVLRNPKILILDEPTSALDAKSEAFISESLAKLMQGRTTFIIAHRLSTVRHANIILVLVKGKIVERGTHDELMAIQGGAYRKLYELQIGLK